MNINSFKKIILSGFILSFPIQVKAENIIYKFPEGFLWGTATASYQVEGGIVNDWSTNGLDAGKSTNHYELYEKDFSTLKDLNNNVHRFSIEWARIEPEEGKFNFEEVSHYKKILKSLKEKNILPMVTLLHFTQPVWVAKMGGWENKEVINYFNRYVKFISEQLKDDVEFWITINEPNVYAFKAYDEGIWPPYKKDRFIALNIIANLIKAHAKAYRTIHSVYKDTRKPLVSFANHVSILQPYWIINPIDVITASIQDKVFNNSFWDAIQSGVIDINIPGLKEIKEPYNEDLKNSLDFIGVNYYTRYLITSSGKAITNQNANLTDIGWEIYPEGLSIALNKANYYASKMGVSIYITENGLDNENDKKRPQYIISHVKKIWDAIQSGIPVKSYIYWTLMDNFEWSDKYKPKFGLMTIDRKMRDSGNVFKNICLNNGISYDLYKNNN